MPYADPAEAREAQRRYRHRHKDKIRQARRRYRVENLEKEKARIRRTDLAALGTTPEQYDEMHERQGGRCAICGRPETATLNGVPKRLAVDHDHETGEVRALLCARCNLGIGKLGDDPALLRRAADYLEAHSGD